MAHFRAFWYIRGMDGIGDRNQLWLLGELAQGRPPNPDGRAGAGLDLSPQQDRFINAYIDCLNATEAAVTAGYAKGSARQQGARLLTNVVIQSEMRRRLQERISAAQLSIAGTLEQLRKLAHSDLRTLHAPDGSFLPVASWPDDISVRIAGYEIEEKWSIGAIDLSEAKRDLIVAALRAVGLKIEGEFELISTRTIKVRVINPNEALGTIAKYLNMLTDGNAMPGQTIDGDFSRDDPAKLVSETQKLLERAARGVGE